MICDNCHGKGYCENPHLFHVPSYISYERGYDKLIQCRKCGGSGFLLGNANEVIDAIDVAIKTKEPLSIRRLKELKLILKR